MAARRDASRREVQLQIASRFVLEIRFADFSRFTRNRATARVFRRCRCLSRFARSGIIIFPSASHSGLGPRPARSLLALLSSFFGPPPSDRDGFFIYLFFLLFIFPFYFSFIIFYFSFIIRPLPGPFNFSFII